MTFSDILKESWLSISTNKIRSFLTVLGIVIGVMAVVVMVAVGETVENQVMNKFSSLGTNVLMIRASVLNSSGVRSGNRQTLTIDDSEYIAKLPDVMAASPIQNASVRVVYGNKNWATSMLGIYPEFADVQNIEIKQGRMFDMLAVRNALTYAIVGPKTVEELEMPANPIGEIIRIQNIPFTVIGITKERGDSVMGSQDDMIIIPISTLKKRVQGSRFPNSVSVIGVKLHPESDNVTAIEQISAILRARHKLKSIDADDFQIMDMKQIMETLDSIVWYLKLLLIAIAAISLLVGAIGIMNMMFVSVAERTREIGIRKAIGARQRHIIMQFLTESILIAFFGSMIGLVLGIGLSQGVGRLIMKYDVPFSIWPVVLSVSVAIFVGLLSGVLPAIKAAKLNPIDSLRYE